MPLDYKHVMVEKDLGLVLHRHEEAERRAKAVAAKEMQDMRRNEPLVTRLIRRWKTSHIDVNSIRQSCRRTRSVALL